MNHTATSPRVLVFGETLVDVFPDRTVLGGAPFNVAYHLKHVGLEPLLVTRLGEDSDGDRLLAAIHGAGLDDRGVQRDPSRPTGKVQVTFGEGGHRFEILEDRAYDFVDPDAAAEVARSSAPRLIYFGTLAQRNPHSRTALDTIVKTGDAPRWLDINLRAPFDGTEVIVRSLEAADHLKLNDEELLTVARRLQLPGVDPSAHAAALVDRFGLRSVLVTCGANGAWTLDRNAGLERVPGSSLDGPIADTVGAGDGFAAVAILGLLRGWPARTILERADRFARSICLIRGAIPPEGWTGYEDIRD